MQLLDPSYDISFSFGEFSPGSVVSFAHRLDLLSYLFEIFGEAYEFVIERSGFSGYLHSVSVLPLMPPRILYRPERHQEGGGAYKHDLF